MFRRIYYSAYDYFHPRERHVLKDRLYMIDALIFTILIPIIGLADPKGTKTLVIIIAIWGFLYEPRTLIMTTLEIIGKTFTWLDEKLPSK